MHVAPRGTSRKPEDRLKEKLAFRGLVAPAIGYDEDPYELWTLHGVGVKRGNYKLHYTAGDGKPIYLGDELARKGYQLCLNIVDANHRVDVTRVRNGQGIGLEALRNLLNEIHRLKAWGRQVPCWLTVLKDRTEISPPSARQWLDTPVEPWTGELEPMAFAVDDTIKYCLRSEIVDTGEFADEFYGQVLLPIEGDTSGRLYFTFKGTLQTDPQYRGFACIGFVGNLYGVEPKKPNNPYQSGENMAKRLLGGPTQKMTKNEVVTFLRTDGKKGWFMIWIGGHAGIIRDGVLFECKHPHVNPKGEGRGFTLEPYNPETESAVRFFSADALESTMGLKDRPKEKPYKVSKLSPPPAP